MLDKCFSPPSIRSLSLTYFSHPSSSNQVQIPAMIPISNPVKAPRIFLSSPHMGSLELEFVREAFATNWIAPLGPHVDAFEREFAETVRSPHAAALSSGTAALHLALKLVGVKQGDDRSEERRVGKGGR